MILRWHRQSGKGVASVFLLLLAGFQRPGLYLHVSPTLKMARTNQWDALDPFTGRAYLSAIPPELVVERNENEMSLVIRTQVPGKVSRILWTSADDPDRL